MNDELNRERRSRSLYRSGAEQLMENSSLRDGLDQDEAQALLDWAIAQAKTAAYATADFDDEEKAADYVDERIRHLTRLMRLITLLTTQHHRFEAEDVAAMLAELGQKWAAFYGRLTAVSTPPTPPPLTPQQLQQANNNHDIFTRLFHYISTPPLAAASLDEEE